MGQKPCDPSEVRHKTDTQRDRTQCQVLCTEAEDVLVPGELPPMATSAEILLVLMARRAFSGERRCSKDTSAGACSMFVTVQRKVKTGWRHLHEADPLGPESPSLVFI